MVTTKKRPRSRRATVKATDESNEKILVWEDDPGSGGSLVSVLAPVAPAEGLTFSILDFPLAPKPRAYTVGSPESRYWIAYESLCRSLTYWRGILDVETPGLNWQGSRNTLPVRIANLVDLNAYYSRDHGLEFGHQNVKSGQIFTADSPDIIAHELGHAVLDALRPDLFDAPSDEINAFHEAFGDISSLLTTLQMKSFRRAVIEETEGNLQYNSRLSRLAEQVAAGIRERRPDIVDSDCMRNAANSFFYAEPSKLEPAGPAIMLTSGRHSFSRVFTGAFLEALAGMTYSAAGGKTPVETDLRIAVQEAGRLLVRAAREAAFVPGFYHEVAVRMLHADRTLFESKYQRELTSAFVRRGILAVEEVSQLQNPPAAAHRKGMATSDRASSASPGQILEIGGSELGFGEICILVPIGTSLPPRLGLSENRKGGQRSSMSAEWQESARLFVKNLVRRGRIAVIGENFGGAAIFPPIFADGKRTHVLRMVDNKFAQITRACFDF